MTGSGARRGQPSGPDRCRKVEGFSLLELVVVLVIVGVTMGVGVVGYRVYQTNTSTRRAADVFRMDLTAARSIAIRERRPVAVVFDEPDLAYRVEALESGASPGRVVQIRNFSPGREIQLSGISLELPDATVVFNARGFADLSGAGGSLGVARFQAGGGGHEVRFTAMGAAEIVPF